jgi:hypothetical protein
MSSKWSNLPYAFINLSQVADLENLHAGIEYYYKGGNDGCYRPRPGDNFFLHFSTYEKTQSVSGFQL